MSITGVNHFPTRQEYIPSLSGQLHPAQGTFAVVSTVIDPAAAKLVCISVRNKLQKNTQIRINIFFIDIYYKIVAKSNKKV